MADPAITAISSAVEVVEEARKKRSRPHSVDMLRKKNMVASAKSLLQQVNYTQTSQTFQSM